MSLREVDLALAMRDLVLPLSLVINLLAVDEERRQLHPLQVLLFYFLLIIHMLQAYSSAARMAATSSFSRGTPSALVA
jgi:uncharacterized membrane protein YjdF